MRLVHRHARSRLPHCLADVCGILIRLGGGLGGECLTNQLDWIYGLSTIEPETALEVRSTSIAYGPRPAVWGSRRRGAADVGERSGFQEPPGVAGGHRW